MANTVMFCVCVCVCVVEGGGGGGGGGGGWKTFALLTFLQQKYPYIFAAKISMYLKIP